MRRLILAAATAAVLLPAAAAADEFEEVVEQALDAYRAGDLTMAREELDYALRLLTELKAEGLAGFLPEPLPGWTRQAEDAQGPGAAFAFFGGATVASASYTRGGESFSLTLVANSPVVSGIAAMVSGMGAMGGGRTVRIQRQQFTVTEGEIQGVVGGAVLVQASGDASVEAMQAHIEAMDLAALGAY